MPAKVGSLYAEINADGSKFSSQLAAAGIRVRGFEQNVNRSFARIDTTVSTIMGRLGAGLAAAFSAREVAQLIDSSTRINNALKVAGVSGQQLETVFASLYQAAQKNAAPLESLATLYGKASQSAGELGASQEDLLKFTGAVGTALRVAGTDATTASGALLQLGQALGSGRVAAEEYNSILEGLPTVAQAAARGLKDAGGSVSRLKTLVVDGKVSSEAFFRAFLAGSVSLETAADKAGLTTSQGFTLIGNALIRVARDFDAATGTSQKFADALGSIADAIDRIDITGFADAIRNAAGELSALLNRIGDSAPFQALAKLLDLISDSGEIVNPNLTNAQNEIAALEEELKTLQERITLNTELGFDNSEALARISEIQTALASLRAAAADMPETVEALRVVPGEGIVADVGSTNSQMGGSRIRGGARRREVKPVSLGDFKPPVAKETKPERVKQSDWDRTLEQYRESTTAINLETAALRELGIATDNLGYATAKARAESDLLTAAQKAGRQITPELRREIDLVSEAYAQAELSANAYREAQQQALDDIADQKSAVSDVLTDIRSALSDGKLSWDDWAKVALNALDAIVDVPPLHSSIREVFE
ncbi:tape measure protein [Allorhizobium pseudoryzae]|uniref:tape measure protein n=1 Tax=Allorhizobium pseudoryzae TaxID=379684 RepID=UPI003D08384F